MESKYRIVHTRFWSDNFIANLNSLDRYLFLYFLTNEHTNIAGIYELPIRTMEFETGLQQEQLLIILERLKEKIVYYEGWILIKNFSKYQSSGEKIDKAIENIKSKIPENIIHHLYSMDTLSISHHIVKESKVNKSKVNIIATPGVADINPLIELFKPINPSYKKLFANTTQRKALQGVVTSMGFEKTEQALKLLPKTNGMQYAPVITTPLQFEQKLGQLIAFLQKEKLKLQENKIVKI